MDRFVHGKPIEGNVCESIRLFVLCEAMKWSHLPVAGGLYDQHPKLLDDFLTIFLERSEVESAKHAKETAKAEAAKRKARGKGKGNIS